MRGLAVGVVLATALGLSGCGTLNGNLGAPTGDTQASLEMYKLYAARCSSQFAWPMTAAVTCERTAPPAPPQTSAADMATAIVQALIAAGVLKPAP